MENCYELIMLFKSTQLSYANRTFEKYDGRELDAILNRLFFLFFFGKRLRFTTVAYDLFFSFKYNLVYYCHIIKWRTTKFPRFLIDRSRTNRIER